MSQFIPFGEWLPDLPALENKGATIAKNVIPDEKSYRPWPKLAGYSGSLANQVKGAMLARDNAGNYYNFAGDTTRLYSLNSLTWNNVTRVSGDYSIAADDYWEFVQFGNTVIAVDGANADLPQAISLGAANFADLAGDPPRARHIAAIRDFVVMGNISASATSPQMVRWCAINNSTAWTPSAATLADFQDLPGDGGWIQKVVGGEYGVIFQERAIYRMDWAGSPTIFQFNKVHTNIGTLAPQSVVSYRNFVFFIAEDGFYMFDGSNVRPIGQNKVDRTFFADLDTAYIYRIHAAIDPVRKIVCWAYPGPGNAGGTCNNMMIYSWGSDRWSRIEGVDVELLYRNATSAITLDNLDSLFPNIDLMQVSLDSNQWAGGNYQFGAFNSNHSLSIFNGSSMAATVETGEHHLNRKNDGLSYITEVRPITTGASIDVALSVATRFQHTEDPTYTPAVAPGLTGFSSFRATGRYHRFRLQTNSGTFTHLQGVDVLGTTDGVR